MLKSLALVLLFTAVACKGDSAPAKATSGGESGASAHSTAPGTPPPRSGKIDLPIRKPAVALPEAGKPEEREGDGRVRRERVMTIDTDGDGIISDEEREAARQKREAALRERLDTDGDGKVSDEERNAARRHRVDQLRTRLDTNNDGKITADELENSRRARGISMESADTNQDGTLSAEELEAAMQARNAERRERFRQAREGGGGAPAQPPTTP